MSKNWQKAQQYYQTYFDHIYNCIILENGGG